MTAGASPATLTRLDPVVAAILAEPHEKQVAMMTRLAFAAAERPRGASARRLKLLLRDHLDVVIDAAAIVARQSGAPIADLLASAVGRRRDVMLAQRILSVIGEGRGRLVTLDATCRRLIVNDLLARGVAVDPMAAMDATALLVGSLHNMGRARAGIATLHKTLAAFRRAGLAPPLGLMCQLGGLLADLGEDRRAAIILSKALRSADNADVPSRDMAHEWINLATVRSRLLDIQGALDAARRAVALLEETPDGDAKMTEERDELLAVALSNYALFVQEAGDIDAAYDAVMRALSLNRTLTARDPDAYAPRLVETLINASYITALRGDVSAAQSYSGQAVAEARRLPAVTLAAHGRGLAASMINFAADLKRLGEMEHALEIAGEAAILTARLLDDYGPSFLQLAVDAEAALCNIGLQASRLLEAQAAGERAIALSKRLSDDAMGLSALSILPNLSDVYAKQGRRRAAKEAAHQAYRLLLEGENGEGGHLIDYETRIGVRDTYAQRLTEDGRTAQAVAIVREAITCAARPSGGIVSALPAHSLVRLANMLADLADLDGALNTAKQAVASAESLAAHDSSWAEEELPTALYTQASIHWRMNDVPAAIQTLERAIALNRRRAARDEQSCLADLAAALEFSAVIASRAGDVVRAQIEINEALSIYNRLAQESGGGYVVDVANGLHNAAMIAMNANDLDRAVEIQERAAALLDGAPQKGAQERRLTADAYVNLGLYYAMVERVDEGMAALDRIPELILDEERDWPPARQTLSGVAVARSRLLVMAGRTEEALDCVEAALASMGSSQGEFWRGAALVNRAFALAALGRPEASAAAQAALEHHRRGLEDGDADDLHGYCDSAAVLIDIAAQTGSLSEETTKALLFPVQTACAPLGPGGGGIAVMELVRALEEHCGGAARWATFLPNAAIRSVAEQPPSLYNQMNQITL